MAEKILILTANSNRYVFFLKSQIGAIVNTTYIRLFNKK